MKISGKNLSRTDLEKRISNIAQLGGTRHYELTEGKAKGVKAVDFRTGAGFEFTVLPDRALDISLASYQGCNLVYLTHNGEVQSSYYSSRDSEWLWNFFGGLLTTCGLTYFSSPGKDGDEDLGLHGRITNIPACQVCDLSGWEGDEYIMKIRGTVEEGILFGDKMRLCRTISSKIGSKCLLIEDEVTNFGYKESPFTILYHINPGFPLVDEGSELILSDESVEPYDEHSKSSLAEAKKFTDPIPGFSEENYFYKMKADSEGFGYAALVNRELGDGLGMYVKFKTDTIPFLSEWKMMGEGDYVVGIEPCNTKLDNRAKLREQNILPTLKAGETRKMVIEIGVLDSKKEINDFKAKVKMIQK